MEKAYYLGLDQGTTGETALLLDRDMRVVARGYHEHRQFFPKPGWVEHVPQEILDSLLKAAEQAMRNAGVCWEQIRSIGLANQGETCLMWDRYTGEPVYPAIVWQDRRTSTAADALAQQHREDIQQRTGLIVDGYFSATKLQWIMDNVPQVREKIEKGQLLAGTLDSWLVWKLTGGALHVTDCATASRTMLFNIHEKRWDTVLLDLLGVPEEILPQVRECAGDFGTTLPRYTGGVSIPVCGLIVDQQSALYAQNCFTPGSAKVTYGTGCFMLMNAGKTPVTSHSGLLTSIAWQLRGETTYALDAGIYVAGAAIQWLKNQMGLIRSAADTEAMALRTQDNGGVYFVPAFSGLAAPHWDQYARGTMVGITGGTTREQIVRATLESIAYQVSDNLKVMRSDSGIPIERIRVDGGMVCNRFLMQFQSDILGIPVEVPAVFDTTAVGAARLAALGHGDFPDPYGVAGGQMKKCYEPHMSEDQRQYLLSQWERAVQRAMHWAR